MNDEDPLMQRAQWVQSNLEEKHGKGDTSELIGAVGQVGGQLGVDVGGLRRMMAGPDAVNEFLFLGKEATLRLMQGPAKAPATRNAEELYSRIRHREREEWRMGKGRR
jgi:hypothetical protein